LIFWIAFLALVAGIAGTWAVISLLSRPIDGSAGYAIEAFSYDVHVCGGRARVVPFVDLSHRGVRMPVSLRSIEVSGGSAYVLTVWVLCGAKEHEVACLRPGATRLQRPVFIAAGEELVLRGDFGPGVRGEMAVRLVGTRSRREKRKVRHETRDRV
jgi:hypothetical protein